MLSESLSLTGCDGRYFDVPVGKVGREAEKPGRRAGLGAFWSGGRNKVPEVAEVEVAGVLLRRCRPRILASPGCPFAYLDGEPEIFDGAVPEGLILVRQREHLVLHDEDRLAGLWVPNTVSPHAAWEYSWIRPRSRSCR